MYYNIKGKTIYYRRLVIHLGIVFASLLASACFCHDSYRDNFRNLRILILAIPKNRLFCGLY